MMTFTITSNSYLIALLVLVVVNLVEGIKAPLTKYRQESDVLSEGIEALTLQYLHQILNRTDAVDLFVPENYKFLTIDFMPYYGREWVAGHQALLAFLNHPERDFLRAGVHEIDVSSDKPIDGTSKIEFEKLLLNVDNLEILRWNVHEPISSTVLLHLESHNPSIKIYYTMPLSNLPGYDASFWRESWGNPLLPPSQAEIEALQSITTSKNLYSLKATVSYGSHADGASLRLVFAALSTCANIKELDLQITKLQLPYSIIYGQPNQFDFRSHPDAKFPPLEVLKLDGYNLDSTSYMDWKDYDRWALREEDDGDVEQSQSKWTAGQQKLLSTPAKSSLTSVEEWLGVMDWSKLHTLHLNRPSASALQTIKGAVTKLKHVNLIGRNASDVSTIMDFVNNNEFSLETLSLTGLELENLDELMAGITRQHQATMKHLTIRARHQSQNTPLILNRTAISQTLSQLPKLESLDINVAIPTEWDYPLLRTFASHPNLHSLTMRVEIQDKNQSSENRWGQSYPDGFDPYRPPNLNETAINTTSTAGLFRYLRKQKVGTPLEKLNLIVFREKGLLELLNG